MRNSMLKENVLSDKGEYIQLEQEYYSRDFAGRHTTIDSGSYGILIKTEGEIETIFDLSPPQKERCLDLFRSAKESSRHFALVGVSEQYV